MNESDETVTIEGVVLKPTDAIDFLSEKSLTSVPCPICATDDWGLSLGPGERAYAIIPTANGVPGERPSYYLPVYTTDCKNCGYTRTHNLIPLAKWKKARTEESS